MSAIEIPYQFIAIEGNIGAGKTTLASILRNRLNAELILEQFSDNPFLPAFYQNPDRHAFSVELFFMAERHKQFQEQFASRSLFTNQIISDYIFDKTLLFAHNNLEEEEFRLFQRLFNVLKSNFPEPDILIFLYRDVEHLLANIAKRNRDFEKKISPEYLLKIQQAYLDYFKTVNTFPIILIDVEDLDFQNDELFLKKIMQRLQRTYAPGLHRLK
ncbi:MAG: deoxynucleoside kinase [Bacteroidia bacterium]|nr:deoxynucleoside kinase [Bacteroidia bacterium]